MMVLTSELKLFYPSCDYLIILLCCYLVLTLPDAVRFGADV